MKSAIDNLRLERVREVFGEFAATMTERGKEFTDTRAQVAAMLTVAFFVQDHRDMMKVVAEVIEAKP